MASSLRRKHFICRTGIELKKKKELKMKIKKPGLHPSILIIAMLTFFCCGNASAQEKNQMVRLAKLVIDTTQLESYKAALKEEIETSVRVEPGVLTLYAVSEKNNPTHVTILEIYADTVAYRAHLQTPHFIKYKTGTKDMIKSLELVATVPIVPGMKIK
jgi:quinol monooxygenase YgiN